MISFLEGTIEYLGDKYVILNTGTIGYRVIVSPKIHTSLSKNKSGVNRRIKLFIHSQLNMREGVFDMYGFESHEDLNLFHLLTTVSGIGPKNAMAIMSIVEPRHLKTAVINEDADYLKKAGVSAKTAQRLVLELKNKVDYLEVGGEGKLDLGQEGEAMEALVALGYSSSQAKEVLKEAKGDTLEKRVREALKILGKK